MKIKVVADSCCDLLPKDVDFVTLISFLIRSLISIFFNVLASPAVQAGIYPVDFVSGEKACKIGSCTQLLLLDRYYLTLIHGYVFENKFGNKNNAINV